MFTIASTTSKTLSDALIALTEEEIEECCESKVFDRGIEYVESDAVGFFHYSTPLNAEVAVAGSRKYKVTVRLQNGEILADCNCPYTEEFGNVCKHIVAALMSVETPVANTASGVKGTSSGKDDAAIFHEYLESLKHHEVVELVERFATKDFRWDIVGRLASGSDADKKLKELHLRLKKVMQANRRRTADNFIDGCTEVLMDAQGYWTHAPKLMIDMITGVIEKYNVYNDNDDFTQDYDDYDYYDDEGGEPDTTALTNVVTNFILSLGTKDKFTAMTEIAKVVGDSIYSLFANFPERLDKLYTDKDIPALINLVLQASNADELTKPEEYYALLSPSLSDSTREALLWNIAAESKKLTIEFVQFLRKLEKLNDAVVALEQYFTTGKKNAEYLSIRLELARERQESTEVIDLFCRSTLIDSKDGEVLRLATQAVPEFAGDYEVPIREYHPYVYYRFLEAAGRLDDCERYFTELRKSRRPLVHEESEFYMRHAQHFPHQAEESALDKINKNLIGTGNHLYDNIATALKVLLVANDTKANEVYRMIKADYKRRRNLMDAVDGVMKASPQKPPVNKALNPFDALPKKRTW
ncbi:MAG: SWIM zinc finger family protein [Ignavibacteria bacterium]|nr:SWIM zinc finger family protein [Ignavibacteria bacterium]